MLTYYVLLQASGVAEGAPEVAVANDVAFMRRYYADWRFLLRQVGQSAALLHIEPDFWGYAQRVNSNPHALPAAVASANPTDCSGMESSIAGMGRCLIAMARTYAPNARVGLHASAWAGGFDVSLNTNPALDVPGDAAKVGAFLLECGADGTDFVGIEASDRDAAWYQTQGSNRWWDATNATLPHFHQAFAWGRAVAEKVRRPLLWWQLPVGNLSLPNTHQRWKDNRVDYFFGHLSEVTATHGAAMAFGPGQVAQTNPATDDGHLLALTRAYAADGGQEPCTPR